MNEKKGRPKSQIMMSPPQQHPPCASSRKPGCDSLPSHRYENEWELKERELAEARQRTSQMEKTMRWWSDCTANWREKWSQVRNERNQAREELRIAKIQLEEAVKQIDALSKQPQSSSGVCSSSFSSSIVLLNSKGSSQISSANKTNSYAQTENKVDKNIVAVLENQIMILTSKLDEANRITAVEREEKMILHRSVERLQRDVSDLQELYDNLKKELLFSELIDRDDHEMSESVEVDIEEDEVTAGNSMEINDTQGKAIQSNTDHGEANHSGDKASEERRDSLSMEKEILQIIEASEKMLDSIYSSHNLSYEVKKQDVHSSKSPGESQQEKLAKTEVNISIQAQMENSVQKTQGIENDSSKRESQKLGTLCVGTEDSNKVASSTKTLEVTEQENLPPSSQKDTKRMSPSSVGSKNSEAKNPESPVNDSRNTNEETQNPAGVNSESDLSKVSQPINESNETHFGGTSVLNPVESSNEVTTVKNEDETFTDGNTCGDTSAGEHPNVAVATVSKETPTDATENENSAADLKDTPEVTRDSQEACEGTVEVESSPKTQETENIPKDENTNIQNSTEVTKQVEDEAEGKVVTDSECTEKSNISVNNENSSCKENGVATKQESQTDSNPKKGKESEAKEVPVCTKPAESAVNGCGSEKGSQSTPNLD